jgi:hypothetical protein
MNRRNLVILALLLAGCTGPSQPASAQPRGAATESAKRSLNSFVFDWATTTVQDLITKVGPPDRDVGGGIYILDYGLQDCSHVWVGSLDNSMIIYVRHGGGLIGEGEILYERRQ